MFNIEQISHIVLVLLFIDFEQICHTVLVLLFITFN